MPKLGQIEFRSRPLTYDCASAIQSVLAGFESQDFIFAKFDLLAANTEQLPTFLSVVHPRVHAIGVLAAFQKVDGVTLWTLHTAARISQDCFRKDGYAGYRTTPSIGELAVA